MDKHDNCPLCHSANVEAYTCDKHRSYMQCRCCELVFVERAHYLKREAEKAIYDLHENAVADPGYRKFLSRLFIPLSGQLEAQSHGLDFGCGPAPALAEMFKEQGFHIDVYDSFYCDQKEVFDRQYDFVTATEVIEHLHQPGEKIRMLWNILRRGGCLGIMTKLVTSKQAFQSWHYKNDLTHVCFFSQPTLRWLADSLHAEVSFYGDDVAIITKREAY